MSDEEFDDEALEELREDLGESFESFLRTFLETLEQGVNEMRGAAERGELRAVSEQAHALKGTAGYLGASRLSARLADLQRDAAEAATVEAVRALIDAVADDASRVRARFGDIDSG